jgi:putative aldouronate transport system permease protein
VPNPPVLTAYETVFSNDMVIGGLFVTFLLIIIGVPYTMFLCSSLAYGLSKKLPGVGLVGFIIVATLYFGGGLIPFYLLMRNLGLINSVFAMILPHGATVFHVIILRNFFQNIPKDIEESAYIDGAKDIRVFAQIIVPMSLPIMVTIGLFVTVQYWNEWWHCLLFINSSHKQSLQYVLRSILIEVNQVRQNVPEDMDLTKIYNEGVKAAVVIITTLPVAVVYPFLQKYFVRGLSSGALKF